MLDMQSIEETRDQLRALEARRDAELFDSYFSERAAIGDNLLDMWVECPPGLVPALKQLTADFKMRKLESTAK